MGKIAIVYWSGTGNTEAMANLVAEGAGGSADLFTPDQFSPDQAAGYSALAFGCPSMGAEQLEEAEFEPMFESVKPSWAARPSACSAPTAGATASGCAPGRPTARTRAAAWWASR